MAVARRTLSFVLTPASFTDVGDTGDCLGLIAVGAEDFEEDVG
jgi:hypothetical protein